jgi:hypothetical protein
MLTDSTLPRMRTCKSSIDGVPSARAGVGMRRRARGVRGRRGGLTHHLYRSTGTPKWSLLNRNRSSANCPTFTFRGPPPVSIQFAPCPATLSSGSAMITILATKPSVSSLVASLSPPERKQGRIPMKEGEGTSLARPVSKVGASCISGYSCDLT